MLLYTVSFIIVGSLIGTNCGVVLVNDAICKAILSNLIPNQPIYLINRCWEENNLRNDETRLNRDCDPLKCPDDLICKFGFEINDKGCEICKCEAFRELYQGDIQLLPKVRKYLEASLNFGENIEIDASKQAAVTSHLPLWDIYQKEDYYILPYIISDEIGVEGVKAVEEAAKDFAKFTCIRLEKRTNQYKYIRYQNDNRGCTSAVGMVSRSAHNISFSPSCWNKGTAIHETLHALGFWHEHSRPDRDNHVTILYDNISRGQQHNFLKFSGDQINSYRSAYDAGSVMHYNSYAFSRNGKPTIVDKKSKEPLDTQRSEFSSSDIEQLNNLYKCSKLNVKPTKVAPNLALLEKCRDSKTFCFSFAINGECTSDKFKSNCCASCRIASKFVAKICQDSRVLCSVWKSAGYCKNSPKFMGKYCCKSCYKPLFNWDLVFRN